MEWKGSGILIIWDARKGGEKEKRTSGLGIFGHFFLCHLADPTSV